MGNNSDQFILEISAKIKNDSAQLIKELRSELSKVEKETKLSISIDEKKTKEYIGKLKQSMNQVSTELKKANVDISSYNKFISVLKEGAEYSKTIADSLKQANNIAKNFTELESVTTGKKDKQKSIRENKNIVKAEFGVLKKQIAQIEKEANGLTKNKTFKKNLASISEILKNPFDHKNVDFSSYKAVQKYINDIYKQVKDIRTEWSLISDEQIANKNDYVKNNTGKLNGIVEGFKDSSLQNINKYKDDFNKMKSLAEQYDLKLKEIGNSSDIAFDITDLKQIEQEFDKLFSKLNSYDDNTINILDSKLNKKTISDELKKIADKDLDKDSIILSYKLDENFNNGIIKLTTDVKKANGEIQKLVYSYDSANGAVKKLTESNKELVNTSKQVSTSFTGSFKDMVKVMTVGLGIEDVIYKLKEGLTLVKDLDTALTEMNKVSNESFSNLQKYAMGSFDEAGLIGTTGLDLQSSTADWMRLGKSMSDAQQLAKDTNVLFNVSEFSNIDAATESMVSMTQAYQEISSNDIVDKLNLVGNNYSMATDELAYSLQRSASALKTAKNDFDEAIALTVAGNSVVQNPEMVAAGVRTISLRMAGTSVAKQELESLGEETDTFLTKSKLNETLEKLTNIDERGGISLLDDNGNYRSTAKVLMDLADRWAEIEAKDKQDGQNRQNALLEALAGKNRASILASILNDKDLLKTVYEDVSTNFDGSALEENAKQMESIEGHLTQLKNKWQEFWASEGNREFITDILDLAQGIIDLTNALGGVKTMLPILTLLFAEYGVDRSTGKRYNLVSQGLSGIVSTVSEIGLNGNSPTLSNALSNVGDLIGGEKDKWKNALFGTLNNEVAEDVGESLIKNTAEGMVKNSDVITDVGGQVIGQSFGQLVKDKGLSSAIQSVGANILGFFTTTPLGIGTAIAAIGATIYAGYKKYMKDLEDAAERSKNEITNFDNTKKELTEFKKAIPDLAKEYDVLRKGVSSTGENLTLTNEEFQKYNEITNQIGSNVPSLVRGYTSTGNAIINMKDSLAELNKEYDILLQNAAKEKLEKSPLSDSSKVIKKANIDNQKASTNLADDFGFRKFTFGTVNTDAIDFGSFMTKLQNDTSDFLTDEVSKSLDFEFLTKDIDSYEAVDHQVFQEQLQNAVKSLSFNDEDYGDLLNYFNILMNNIDDEQQLNFIKKLKAYFEKEIPKYKKATNQKLQDMLVVSQAADEYYTLDAEERTLYDNIVSNFSQKTYDKYAKNDGKDIEKFLNKYVQYVNSKKGEKNISSLEDYQNVFFGKGTSVTEGNKNIDSTLKEVAKGMGVSTEEIEKSFDIDTSSLKKVGADIVEFKNNVLKSETGAILQNPDADKKALKELQDKFNFSQLNKISNNLDLLNEEDVLENYKTNFQQIYDSYESFFVDYVDSISKITSDELYTGTNKSFSELTNLANSYSSTLAEINTFGNENVKITDEMAETLSSYGDEFSQYITSSEGGTGKIITNIEAIKKLIKEKQLDASIDAKNSKNKAREQYEDLTKSLVEMTDVVIDASKAGVKLDDSIQSTINSTRNQLFTLEQTIQKYQQLEVRLLGATNAFDVYNKAVEADAENNAYSTSNSMLESIKSGFETGKMGTETFKSAIQGILSDETFSNLLDIDNVEKRVEKMKTLYNGAKKYFTTDDEGNPTLTGIQNFINDGFSKGLFTSNNLENFDVKSGVSIDDFVNKLGYSKELIYSIFENIQSYNADWGDSIFEGLSMDSSEFAKLSKSTEDATDNIKKYNDERLRYLNLLNKTDKKKEPETWKNYSDKISEYTNKIDKEKETIENNDNKVSDNVKTYYNEQSKSTTYESNLTTYNKKLKELEKEYDKIYGKGNPEAESKLRTEISDIKNKIDETTKSLSNAVSEKERLGEPTSIELEIAKPKLEAQLSSLKKQKANLEKTLSSSNISEDVKKETEKSLETTKDKIKELETAIQGINTSLGIDEQDTASYNETVNEVIATKEELGMPVEFSVMTSTAEVQRQLDNVLYKQGLIDKDVTITYHYESDGNPNGGNGDSPALGKNNTPKAIGKAAKYEKMGYYSVAFGNAYAGGKTLVGELGAETVVDPWSGQYRVVGVHGAEMLDKLPKDAIIFNHKQTEQLQKNGKITSRGKLAPNPSTYMKGFAKSSPYTGDAFAKIYQPDSASKSLSSSKKSSKKSSSSSSSSSEVKSVLDDIFDWIEIRLERLSNTTQKWITLAENAISKNVQKSHYLSAINSTATELNQNQTAKDKYLAYANSIITGAKKSGFSNFSSYAKKVREGTLNLQSIKNEQLLEFINSYKEMYDKAVDCGNAVMDLTGELQDLAESLYNLPIEHAEKKIEKYSDKMDVLSAKYTNYRAYYTQNPALDEQLALQKSIKSAYASAYKETKSNLSSAKGKINNVNDSALKGLSASQKQKIISYVNEGKEINISNKYSANLKKALANYNAALEANRVVSNEAAKASAEYTTMLRENNNAKYENITAYYEYKRSLDEANLSKLDAQIAYRESMGYSAVSTHAEGQKAVYDEMIKYNSDILKQLRQERSHYNDEDLIKMYENGELSREDYFALRSRIQEIDEAIYSTTTALNEARDEIYNLDIKRFDFIIEGIAKAIEKFKNIISLKDSRNVDALESDYVSQNKGLISQIETLNKKREAILDEMKYYNVESDKYQELASNLQDVENEVYSKLTELEENKNAIMELRFKPLVDSVNELSEQISDLEHLRDLLSDYTLIDDKGAFTDSGLANILLIAKAIDNTNQQITDYRYALEMLEKNYNAGNLSQQEFTEQSREYVELIQNAVSSVDGYKDALIDLYEEQLKIENDALKESISLRKEALEKKKSYYDYDKTLKTSNKDIVNLKNQIAALEGVNNASAKAEVARLKAQLSEAEEELADTKYDHSIQLQLDGYDEMTKSADEMLNELLEDLKNNAQLQEQVVSNMLNNIVNTYDVAYSKIKDIINSTAVNNTTSNSLNTSGENIANSSTTSPTDRNPSYSGISSSTIESGNSNTANIESSITNGSLNETNRKVARITTSLTSVSLEVGKTQKLTCTVQPSDAQNKTLSVKSSNTGVATVSISGTNITITAKGKGSCTVTVYSNDGGASASVGVTVTAPVVTTPTTTTTTKPKTTTTTSTSKTTTSTTTTTKPKTTTTSKKSSTAGYISSLSGNISKSSSSSTVKKVQKALKALGFKGKDGKALTIDGKWGTNTDYAVKSFQKSSKYGGKITADGIIGKNTKAKFKKAGYFKGGIVDTVIDNATFLDMIRANRDDGLITAKLGEGIIPKNMMPDFTKQLEQFNSIPADKIMNSINTNSPSFEINVDKFMEVKGNVDNNCVNDLKSLENSIAKNITKTLTQEFRKLGYK